MVNETVQTVKQHIELDSNLQITLVPALPFPWFSNIEQSIWTNGFTNCSQSIWIAIPANPDIPFLHYLLAHELHHSAPNNPMYKLTIEHFPLKEWYKMEGTAEYFSLQLFEDKRWWKESFTLEGGSTLNKFPKIIGFLFLIINFCFVCVSLIISDFFVKLERLNELNGYMLTDKEEVTSFLIFSIPMFMLQVLFLYFIFNYLKKRHVNKPVIILYLVANSLLFLWFVFNVYQFTINGY
ncbi:DUF2268 domain-containing putative Zn-dependent protease [Solibacillus palustris]|uniref:DUF2268 domain-containing putative Zn-dependent protease n=1 Tax=Solibacillus palustris TaxID=2908203 RepID=UPI0038CD711D